LSILLLSDCGRMRFVLIMNDELCHEAVVPSFKVKSLNSCGLTVDREVIARDSNYFFQTASP
jgi:hypothetical protein